MAGHLVGAATDRRMTERNGRRGCGSTDRGRDGERIWHAAGHETRRFPRGRAGSNGDSETAKGFTAATMTGP